MSNQKTTTIVIIALIIISLIVILWLAVSDSKKKKQKYEEKNEKTSVKCAGTSLIIPTQIYPTISQVLKAEINRYFTENPGKLSNIKISEVEITGFEKTRVNTFNIEKIELINCGDGSVYLGVTFEMTTTNVAVSLTTPTLKANGNLSITLLGATLEFILDLATGTFKAVGINVGKVGFAGGGSDSNFFPILRLLNAATPGIISYLNEILFSGTNITLSASYFADTKFSALQNQVANDLKILINNILPTNSTITLPVNLERKGDYKYQNIAACATIDVAVDTLRCNACKLGLGLVDCSQWCARSIAAVNNCIASGGLVELANWQFGIKSISGLPSFRLTNLSSLSTTKVGDNVYGNAKVSAAATSDVSINWFFRTVVSGLVGLNINESTSVGRPTFDARISYTFNCRTGTISDVSIKGVNIGNLYISNVWGVMRKLIPLIDVIEQFAGGSLDALINQTVGNLVESQLSSAITGKTFPVPYRC